MKKILLVSLLALVGTSAQAASIALPGNATAASQTAIAVSDCALLSQTININLSANNLGAVECDTTNAAFGVAIGNNAGKGVLWSGGSVGGGISSTAGQTLPFTTTGAPATKAAAEAARSS